MLFLAQGQAKVLASAEWATADRCLLGKATSYAPSRPPGLAPATGGARPEEGSPVFCAELHARHFEGKTGLLANPPSATFLHVAVAV